MNPLQKAAVRRKAFYFAAILAIFSVSIFYRGLEAKEEGKTYVWVPFGRDDRDPRQAQTAVNLAADWLARFEGDQSFAFGSALLRDGDQVYVYGYAQREKGLGMRKLVVARVPAEKLADFAAWRFRTSKGWSEDAKAALERLKCPYVLRDKRGKIVSHLCF